MENIDFFLFKVINQDLTNPIFDLFFPFITNVHKNTYFIILASLYFIFLIYKNKLLAGKIILTLTIGIILSDTFSYRFIKSHILRKRPHQISELNSQVRVAYAPQSPSFPSNHAMNTTMVMLILIYFSLCPQWFAYVFILVMAYSRVYVGVHFVSDVLSGIVLGTILFYLYIYFIKFFKKKWIKN